MERIVNCRDDIKFMIENGNEGAITESEQSAINTLKGYKEKFALAMDDDLNTADGISAIFEMVTAVNTELRGGASKAFASEALKHIKELADVLGILQKEDEEEGFGEEIEALVAERQEARAQKNFARADEIRDQLKTMGITLKDTPQGVQIVRE